MAKKSENTFEFSINKIRKLDPPATGKVLYHDDKNRELCLQVFYTGRMDFVVYYTIIRDGQRKTAYYNLGKWSNWSIDEAREKAAEIKKFGKSGIDYREYEERETRRIAGEKTVEQVQMSLESVGGLEGQLGRAWDDMIKRKFDLGEESLRHLKKTYRKHVMEFWGEEKWIKDITEQEVIEWKSLFDERMTMWNTVRGYLSECFEFEIRSDRLTKNVVKYVKSYNTKKSHCVLTDKGIQQFLDIFGDPYKFKPHERNYCRYIYLLLHSGQRPINLRSLLKEDDGEGNFVDWENRAFVYRKHKTAAKSDNEAENVHFDEEVLRVLKEASAENPESPWAIPLVNETPRYKNSPLADHVGWRFFNRFRDQMETEGQAEFTMYKLRHTYATKLLASGVPLHEVGRALMHTPNSNATKRYAKVLDQTNKKTAEVAGSIFAEYRKKAGIDRKENAS